jgi:hypothetical protein
MGVLSGVTVENGGASPINETSSAVSCQSRCLVLALRAGDVVVSVAHIVSSVNARPAEMALCADS